MIRAELVHDAGTDLGEGVTWSPVENLLLWVDVNRGDVYRYDHADGPAGVTRFDATVGSVSPRRDGGWILGLGPGVALTGTDDRVTETVTLPGVLSNHRSNDAAVDPAGRLFQGTMTPVFAREPTAHLFRVDPDRSVRPVLDGVTISNGIGWSPNQTLMYYIDTEVGGVDMFDYQASTGEIAERRPFLRVDRDAGRPDGMTVDRDGCLWVAFYWAGCVRRYSPDAELLDVIEVGVPGTTSCAFGGPDLDTLYISTGTYRMTEEAVAAHPGAGGLFAAAVDAVGQAVNLFAG